MHNPDRPRWRREGRASWKRSQESLKSPRIVSLVTSWERWSRPHVFRGPGSIPHAVNTFARRMLEAPRG